MLQPQGGKQNGGSISKEDAENANAEGVGVCGDACVT